MKKKNKWSTFILLAVFFVGLSVMLYPTISSYWNSRTQSQAIVDYEKMLESIKPEDYSAIFAQADDYNEQLAQMNFNMEIIRNVYQTAREYDYIAKPTYWSEMDSYHVLNVFSLFCAGQLLQDPDMPSEELYEMISVAAVGPEYAADFAEMLSIIQDARS